MKWLDRYLRDLRIAQALPFIPRGGRLLDIGCFDQTLLHKVSSSVREAVGIDPLVEPSEKGNVRVLRGTLPWSGPNLPDLLATKPDPAAGFSCITMLAVLEHIPDTPAVARECHRLLAPGGTVVITVPISQVDHILKVLSRLRLIEGMSLEEHHGYNVKDTVPTFSAAGFKLRVNRGFELGLNRLFVFEKA